jgi:predicted Zn finger-like uncharacterized protein|tara:strand:+ start:23 stop:541 length:519 start_codon:yes stop_codon:yes gene_type:complete
MILSCNSCKKKFVVPDQAITAAGRTVQCGSCGSKWKQFPIKSVISEITSDKKINTKKTPSVSTTRTKNTKNTKKAKIREVNLYSPEYLKKKHGISLNNFKNDDSASTSRKISFGFYNSLILFIVAAIFFSRSLYFFQNIIVETLPSTKFYIDYFFESIRNLSEIWKNLVSSY